MPRATSKKWRADETVVSWQAFSTLVDGVEHTIARGTRLRGDHPAVRGAPWAWVRDGIPQHEMPDPVTEVLERKALAEPPPEADLALATRPQTFGEADIAVLDRDLRVAVGTTGDGLPVEVVELKKGSLAFADEDVVSALPDAFQLSGGLRLRRGR
jgi:hypothetical protein